MSRRRAIGLGIAGIGFGVGVALDGRLGRLGLAKAGAIGTCTGSGGATNLVVNGSFEAGPPGPSAPGWTFVLPPPPP